MLPKCVLPSIKRAGRNHKLPDIGKLCDRWQSGDHLELWAEAVRYAQKPGSAKVKVRSQKACHDAAITLAQNGLFSKACRVLTSSGIAPNTPTTWEKLLAKHPEEVPPTASDSVTTQIQLSSNFNLRAVLSSFPDDTACGPSGLRAQHLVDACEATMPVSLLTTMRHVINILLRGDAPPKLAPFLSGANVTALIKKVTDVRPIAAGEILRRFASKCVCVMVQEKAGQLFQPLQLGVACPGGREQIVHQLREVVDKEWSNEDFVIFKVDMANAFNSVSRQAVMDECFTHFPELLEWVKYLYGQHPRLYHPMGEMLSQTGVQQGDPLGPLLFALVLNDTIRSLDPDLCLKFHAWYLDDGVFCGSTKMIHKVIKGLEAAAEKTGLVMNLAKCELFSQADLGSFPARIVKSSAPNLEILGAPIGEDQFCSNYIDVKREEAGKLLKILPELRNPQIALNLLRSCGSFCRLAHLGRCTPPLKETVTTFANFDDDVRRSFEECLAIETTETAWKQAKLSLSNGGMGLRSLSEHCSAAYIASFAASVRNLSVGDYLPSAIDHYNERVVDNDAIESTLLVENRPRQRNLSAAIDKRTLASLIETASAADKARLVAVSTPHSSMWLKATPSPGLGLEIRPNQMAALTKWWLGLDLFLADAVCPRCPNVALDQLAHHALTCNRGPDVCSRHNTVRDCMYGYCNRARLNPKLEAGAGLGWEQRQTRPADILLPVWVLGSSAALDITVVHPLNPKNIIGASASVGSVVAGAAERKHANNDTKCSELGWVCVPMVISSYGEWGDEAMETIKRIAGRLAVATDSQYSTVQQAMLVRLSVTLMRANAIAILSRGEGCVGAHELKLGGGSFFGQ
jgi:hypothetical protein